MKINSEIKIKINAVTDVICDRCDKSCKRENDSVEYNHDGNHYKSFDYAEMTATWGYYSRKDTELHTIVLCEDCYDETLKVMNIKPRITYYL